MLYSSTSLVDSSTSNSIYLTSSNRLPCSGSWKLAAKKTAPGRSANVLDDGTRLGAIGAPAWRHGGRIWRPGCLTWGPGLAPMGAESGHTVGSTEWRSRCSVSDFFISISLSFTLTANSAVFKIPMNSLTGNSFVRLSSTEHTRDSAYQGGMNFCTMKFFKAHTGKIALYTYTCCGSLRFASI